MGSRTGTGTVLSNKRNGTLSRETCRRAPVGPDHLFKGDSLHSAALLTAGEGAEQSGPAGPVGRGELRESGSRWRGGQRSGPCHGLRVPGLCQAGSVTPALPAPAFAERRGSGLGWGSSLRSLRPPPPAQAFRVWRGMGRTQLSLRPLPGRAPGRVLEFLFLYSAT